MSSGRPRCLNLEGGACLDLMIIREGDVVVCVVDARTTPDLAAVEVLARIALALRADGHRLEVHASPRLRALIAFVGLSDAVPCVADSVVEPRR